MANNQYVNKVEYAGQTLIDLTEDTVTPNSLLSGVTAHAKDGSSITGTVVTASPYDSDPEAAGVADPGSSNDYSRGDHVHPSEIPSQTGNSGKFLTTDGTGASWATISEEIFFAEYGVTTYAEVLAAYNADKEILALSNSGTKIFQLIYKGSDYFTFTRPANEGYDAVKVDSDDEWTSDTINFVRVGNVNAGTDITSGTLGVARGGTAVTSAALIKATYGVEYIVGTQTASTNAWTGTTVSAALYNGKTIAYKLPYAGTSTAATLNLTLSGGGTTGAKGVRINDSNVTTNFAANSVIVLVYDGTYWRVDNYNSNTTYSAGTGLSLSSTTFNHSNSVTAGTAGTSSATSGSTLAVPYVTYDAQGHITATGTHTHTVSGFAASSHNHAAGDINSGTLGVARGGTGAASFTANCAIISGSSTTAALTTRAITNNTSTSTSLTANTNLVTANTLHYTICRYTGRTTLPSVADTNYTTYMFRGQALNSSDTNPTVNGAISWTYA